jgi:hypothetical protein
VTDDCRDQACLRDMPFARFPVLGLMSAAALRGDLNQRHDKDTERGDPCEPRWDISKAHPPSLVVAFPLPQPAVLQPATGSGMQVESGNTSVTLLTSSPRSSLTPRVDPLILGSAQNVRRKSPKIEQSVRVASEDVPPILEFDADRAALIDPYARPPIPNMPKAAVACHFPDLIEELCRDSEALMHLPSMGTFCKIDYGGRPLGVFYPGEGAPLAAVSV